MVTEKYMRRTLVVMANAPIPGEVETGLCPPLSPDDAAGIYESFLMDTLEKAASVPDTHLVIYYTPDEALSVFREIVPCASGFLLQDGESTAEKLNYCFEQMCEPGVSVVVVGTNSPTLPARSLELAFDVLASGEVDVVFGPAHNGGSYLIGMNTPHPELFSGNQECAPDNVDKCVETAAREGLGWYLLPKWYTVDGPDDLKHLTEELSEDEIAGHLAMHTLECVSGLAEQGTLR